VVFVPLVLLEKNALLGLKPRILKLIAKVASFLLLVQQYAHLAPKAINVLTKLNLLNVELATIRPLHLYLAPREVMAK
jgi:hypothetical protein